MRRRIGALMGSVVLVSVSAFAQRGEAPTGFSLVGLWSGMYHEDELERTDPGPPPGDYTGIPDQRRRALSRRFLGRRSWSR